MPELSQPIPTMRRPGASTDRLWSNVWHYRDLVRNLVAKDIKVRYMDAVLGFIWALVNPLIITLMYLFIFTFIFPSRAPHYALYLVTGILHWILFANVIVQSSELLVANAGLVKKIYFPHILVPFASLLVNFTLWLFALGAYLLLFSLLGGQFSLVLLAYPGYLLMLLLFTFGISLVLSILYVHFRDLKHIVEIVLQVAFWSAPIVYTPQLVPAKLALVYRFNPLVEFTLIFERLWHENRLPSLDLTLSFGVWTLAALLIGGWLFHRWAHRLVEEL